MIIDNEAQLLEFIKRKDVTLKQAQKVVGTTLRLVLFEEEETKEEFILKFEAFLDKYGGLPITDRPLWF